MNQVERHAILKRCGQLCLWLNIGLMLIKLWSGHIYDSRSLFADGIHSLLDVSADLFVLYAISMSNLPKDDRHPYGYSRYETLANIVISLMLLLAAYAIMHDAILGLHQPMAQLDVLVGVVAIISIVLNELSYQYVSKYARELRSDLLLSTAVHQRADAATSFIVLIATVASTYQLYSADIIGAIGIALMILYYAIPSLLKSVHELLDQGLDAERLEKIRQAIHTVPGVIDHHLLRTRLMAEKGYVDVHVVVSPRISVSEGHYIGDSVEEALLVFSELKDITVHIDAEDDQDHHTARPSREAITQWLQAEAINTTHIVIHYLNNQVELELYVEDRPNNEIKFSQRPKWLARYCIYTEIKVDDAS